MKTPEDKTVREAQSREQYDPTAKQKAAAKLSHPNIAQIHDIGEADGAFLQLGVRARQVPFEGHQGV